MPTSRPRGQAIAASLACFAALAFGLVTLAQDDDPLPGEGLGQVPRKLTTKHYSATSRTDLCVNCHSQDRNQLVPEEDEAIESILDYVRLDEVRTWSQQDKHRLGYKSLETERSQTMGELLGYDVTKDARCLNCHAPAHVDPRRGAQLKTEGVSCSGCHGAYLEWTAAHILDQPKWVALPPDVKAQYGLTNLRDPEIRAELCASCHVGSVAEGKVVTHDMYAAGHPPLPSFEAATFSKNQPPHWWATRDVGYLKANPALQPFYDWASREFQESKVAATGSLVTFREAMALVADEASPTEETPEGGIKPSWPDLARFDCYGCHQELKTSGPLTWQSSPQAGYVLGRPPATAWPDALLRFGAIAAGPDRAEARLRQLDDLQAEFHQALSSRPYGDRAWTSRTARALADWTDAIVKDVKDRAFDRDVAVALIGEIVRQGRSNPPGDYESARQLVWALRTLYDELDPAPENDDRIQSILDELNALLFLDLYRDGRREKVEETLGVRLDAINGYDPEAIRRAFSALAPLVPER